MKVAYLDNENNGLLYCCVKCNDNNLVELPVDIGLIVCLEELRAHNNRLSQLPVSISALSRLRRVSFSGNPLTNIPVDFPERASDVRLYLESLQEDPVANKTVKLVVVGQEGVGKTCLLKALRRTSWLLPARLDQGRTLPGAIFRWNYQHTWLTLEWYGRLNTEYRNQLND